ncbi:hypothetical protein NMB1589 [Neisseria meningitidis MC58]|uniref:Uncharacterized protein n=1 Tax=Neisseria meningitidis serogroup B (strain ATCC BAA-335 / MC58) TaxID=122586 RepID=Q9JYH1_NEIMB|nr:hypothetical protein NMB1589 [Neisseria meningitidis MC58]
MVCRHKLSAVVRRFYCTLPDGISRTRKNIRICGIDRYRPQPQRTGNQTGCRRAALPAFLLWVRQFVHRRQYRQNHQGGAG